MSGAVAGRPLIATAPGYDAAILCFAQASLAQTAHRYLREAVGAGAVVALDSVPVSPQCGPGCAAHCETWWSWFERAFDGSSRPAEMPKSAHPALANLPLALVAIPETLDGYLRQIGDKSRNMIRKALRAGYSVRPFVSAGYLDDIFAINTSKEERGGTPMPPSYRQYPRPMEVAPERHCARHGIANIGCFIGETLVAYCNLHILGELAIINRILGHGAHLRHGIMNLLVRGIVEYGVSRYPLIRAVNYLTLHSGRAGIDAFKRSVGFRSWAVLLCQGSAGHAIVGAAAHG
ncbi:MAG: hypothetical protein JO305_08575 [Alphaproteobacteria bacterium]|nr:hypothetical protein [Alphaproteobacteria bacterium]